MIIRCKKRLPENNSGSPFMNGIPEIRGSLLATEQDDMHGKTFV